MKKIADIVWTRRPVVRSFGVAGSVRRVDGGGYRVDLACGSVRGAQRWNRPDLVWDGHVVTLVQDERHILRIARKLHTGYGHSLTATQIADMVRRLEGGEKIYASCWSDTGGAMWGWAAVWADGSPAPVRSHLDDEQQHGHARQAIAAAESLILATYGRDSYGGRVDHPGDVQLECSVQQILSRQ